MEQINANLLNLKIMNNHFFVFLLVDMTYTKESLIKRVSPIRLSFQCAIGSMKDDKLTITHILLIH